MTISVLISVYANERQQYLELALQSLADQTYIAEEVVMVEDGPIGPDLKSTIDRYRDRLNIQSVVLPINVGLGAALSEGLKRCSGDLVARMDCDDVALPTRFQRQLDAFNANAQLKILSGYAFEIDGEGRRGRMRTVPTSNEAIRQTMWANPIIHPATMFRRVPVTEVGGYSSTAIRCEDYELWLRCAAAGMEFANIPEPLIEYRFTPETHKRNRPKSAWRQGNIGFRGSRKIGLPLWKQLACFIPYARSLLPMSVQHRVYRFMHQFDPRNEKRPN